MIWDRGRIGSTVLVLVQEAGMTTIREAQKGILGPSYINDLNQNSSRAVLQVEKMIDLPWTCGDVEVHIGEIWHKGGQS